jgi:hypothetical protein
LIEQYRPILKPRSHEKLGAVVCFPVGDAEPIDRLVGDVVEQVEPRSTLIPSSRLEFF